MRTFSVGTLLLVLLLSACFRPNDGTLTPEFALSDTLGNPTTEFYSGESFRIHFSVVNTLRDTLTYTRYDTGPVVRFMIMQEDSVIATSVDGLGFHLPVFEDYFLPGDTIKAEWLAPTTPWQDPKCILESGIYKASVISPIFDHEKIRSVSDIQFSIIE